MVKKKAGRRSIVMSKKLKLVKNLLDTIKP